MYEELYELLTDTMEPEEALEWIKKFSNMIENDPDEVIKGLDDLFLEKCQKENLCPNCIIPLQTKVYLQYSEYEGIPTNEPLYVPTCVNCAYELE